VVFIVIKLTGVKLYPVKFGDDDLQSGRSW